MAAAGALSPDANGGEGSRGDLVILALPVARHICLVCSEIFDRRKALKEHKRGCRLPAPAAADPPPAPLPQQKREKRPRVAVETSWSRTRPRSARARRVVAASDPVINAAVLPAGPTVIIISDSDEVEEADRAVGEINGGGAAEAAADDPRWYACEVCGNRYESTHAQQEHHRNAHLQPPVTSSIRLFGVDIVKF